MTSYPAVSALSMIASGSGDSPGTESTTPRPGLAALAAAAAGRTGATPRGHPDSDDIGGNRKPSVAFTPTTEDHTAASCQSSSRVFYPALAAVSSWATTRNSHMQSVPALSAAAALTPLAVSECIVVADKSRRKSQAIELERAKSLHRKSIAMLVPYALPALAHPGSTLTNPSSHTALSAVAQMFAAKVRLSIPDQAVPSGPFAANHTALNTLFHAAPPGMQARKVMSSLKSASVELAPAAPSPRTPKSPSAMTSDGVDPTSKTGNAHGEQGAAGATNDNSGNSGNNNNGSFPDGQERSADDGQSTTQLDAFSPTSMSAVAGSPRPMDFASPVRAMPRAIGNMMSPGDESLALGAGRDDNDGDQNENDAPSRAAGSTGAANGGSNGQCDGSAEDDADPKKERGLTGETQAWLSAVNGPAVRACVSLALEASNVNQRDKTGQTPRVPSTTSSQFAKGSQNAAPYTALRCLGEASRAKALPRTGAELTASIEDRHVRSTSPISRNAIPVPHPSSGVLGMMVQEVKRQEVEEEREKQASMAAKGMHPPPSIAEDKYPALEGVATLMAQTKLRGAPATSTSSTTKAAVSTDDGGGANAHQHDEEIPTTKEATATAAEEQDIGSLEVVIAAATAKTSQGQLPGLSSLEAASRSQSVDPEHSANANAAIDIAPSSAMAAAAANTTVSNTAGPSADADGVASPGSSAPDAKPLAPTPPPRREPSVDVSPRRENGATEEAAKVATRQEDVMVQRGGQTITTATVGVAKRAEPQRHEEAVQHKSATLETHTVETADNVNDTHGNAGGQNDDGSHLYVEEKLNKLDPNRPPSAVFNYRAKPTGEGLQRVFTSTLRHMARHAMTPDAFLGLHLLHSATMDVKRSEPHKYIAIDPQIVWPGDDHALASSMLGASSLAPMATAATPASPNAAMNQQQATAGGKASPPLRNTTTKGSPARPPMGAPGFPGGRSLQNSLSPMRGTIGGAASLLRGSVGGRSRTGAGLGVGGALPDTAPEIGSNAPARPPHLPPLSESAAAVALRLKAEAAAQQSDNTRSSTAPQPPAGPPPRLTTAKRIDRRLAKLKSELSVLEEVQKMRRAQVQQNAKARVAKNRHLAPLVAAQRLKQQQQLQQQQQAQQQVLSGTTSPLQQAISPNGTLGAQGASAGGAGIGASGSPLKQLSPTGASPGPVSPKGGIFRELHEQKMLEQQLTPPSTGRVSLRSGSGPAPAGEGSLGDAVAAS